MFNRALLCFFLLASFSRTSSAADILKQLIKSLQDLTVSLNSTEVDLNKISVLGQQLLDFAKENQQYLATLSELAPALNALNDSINKHVPTTQTCLYAVGGSIILASLIGTLNCAVPRLLDYCHRKKRKGGPLLYEEYDQEFTTN